MMNTTVHRHYEFSPNDIREALIEWLRVKDMQYPDGNETTFTYKLTEDGASLSWSKSY